MRSRTERPSGVTEHANIPLSDHTSLNSPSLALIALYAALSAGGLATALFVGWYISVHLRELQEVIPQACYILLLILGLAAAAFLFGVMRSTAILVAQECIGDGRWLLSKGIEYAKERVVFDRPIGQNQGVQFPLARAYAELEAADMICRRAAALFDAGQECGADANIAKLLASEATWHAAEATFSAYGGFAFAREYDIERKWREARLYQTAPISTNLILAYIGQHVLGLPRSY